ncbi:uncharacterized protein LOC119391184 [Rhipicephalus sanguineus]|uniref:uncharacterized protein LOC119391184 n=1 Tax=Rhipicephalus sanguineus TaxID=34632 RepID=UPI0020C47313|nr:uncharacterized protein LOC119391184 [Rhipicephalus sanguineus]
MLTYPESTDFRKRRIPNRILCSYVAPVFLSPMLVLADNQDILGEYSSKSKASARPDILGTETRVSLVASVVTKGVHREDKRTRVRRLESSRFSRQNAMRFAFCSCLMAVYWVFESMPFVATSLLPLLLLPFFNVMPPGDVASGYVSEPVLSLFLGLSFALALRHGTSLYTRASFALLQCFGTRVRSLMLGFLGCTLVLTQVLGASLTAVLMVYTVECAMAEIQNDVIREEQFKAYAQKFRRRFSGGRGLMSNRRTKSEDRLSRISNEQARRRASGQVSIEKFESPKAFSDNSSVTTTARSAALTDQSPPQTQERQQASANKSPASSSVEKAKRRGTIHVNLNVDSASVPLQARSRSSLAATPSRSALDGSSPDLEPRKASMRDRKISIYERGKTLRPGEEDLSVVAGAIEPKKPISRKKSSIFGGIREFIKRRFTTSTYVDSSYLQERIAWEKERYTTIQKDLLIGIALTASVGSITSFHSNYSNIVLSKYYDNNSDRKELTTTRWLLVTLPVAASAVAFAWSLLMMGYLERYDADEDEDARYAISHVLKHKYYEISNFSFRDCLILFITLAWCGSKILFAPEETLTEDKMLHAPTSLLLGEALFVALFSLPGKLLFWREAPPNDAYAGGRLASWSRVASSMPWGVLIVYGCVHSMLIASRVSGFSALASDAIRQMNNMDPVTIQLILTCTAALLTEVVSSTTTASMLVPMAVTLAKQSNTHPLYLAIPVAVASSTSLVTPVSCTAITVVVSYAEISIADLLIPGLMIKAFMVTSVLLSVNTIGEYVFNFDEIDYAAFTARVNYSHV